MRDLTEKELELLEMSRSIANGFADLPQSHPADMEEVVTHLHGIQNIILARPATEYLQGEREKEIEEELARDFGAA